MSGTGNFPQILSDGKGRVFIVPQTDGVCEIDGIGVVDAGKLRNMAPGSIVEIAGKEFVLLRASLLNMLNNMKRGPQIIMPKDSVQIMVGCGIGPGDQVLEIGTGSGALTMVLAYYVGQQGKVVTFEESKKNAEIALRNLGLAGLDGIVEIHAESAAGNLSDAEFDAAVMDIPQPWDLLDEVSGVLKVSGYVCAYVPTMNQVENTIHAMREAGYAETRALENLQREIVVGKGGTRPSFDMLGHTGYICFGRKIR